MANKKSNYPNATLDDVNGSEIVTIYVNSLMELAEMGKPRNEKELKDRITAYFKFCADKQLRPGIEGLCLSLSITRMTFWNWCNRSDKFQYSEEWTNTCVRARQLICSFLELTATHGRLNPTTFIFLSKNWMGYDDKTTIESIGLVQEDRYNRADFDSISRYRNLPMFQEEQNEAEEDTES